MTNDQIVEKFWLRMGEKFGKRWIEERGTKANDEWRALLQRYTEYQVQLALDELPKWSHPPTHPEMAAHLRAFAHKAQLRTPQDYSRDRWRSFILAELSHWGWAKGLWRIGTPITSIHEPMKSRLFQAARTLLDAAVAEEVRLGKEPPGMVNRLSKDCEGVIASLHSTVFDKQTRELPGEKHD